MRLTRFYLDQPLRASSEVQVQARAAHHLTRVLRLRPGAKMRIFDGRGAEFEATLEQASRDGVRIEVGAAVPGAAESPLRITLAQSISRSERMDLVMQKATELGVARIVPLVTERRVVRLDPDRAVKRREHWRRVVIGAAEQSGRCVLPGLDPVTAFGDWLASLSDGATRLVPTPGASRHPGALPAPADNAVVVAIGPEGGFSPFERDSLNAADFIPVGLGPRVLRTETAALAAIAVLQALWGDMAG